MSSTGPLAGRVALVTGASRRTAISAAVVRRLVDDGAAVLVACKRNSFAFGDVRVRASQGRRESDTGRLVTEENAARCVPGGRET